jgi:protein-tyrosine-phosphatase
MTSTRPVVLFLCVHNAGRSQMAAAFARQLGGNRLEVLSAGSDPGTALNPAVVAAMSEVGLDISQEQPKVITDVMAQRADVVVTMGCGDASPYYRGKRYLDWELLDPAGRDIATVRTIRADIEQRVRELLRELNVTLDVDDA